MSSISVSLERDRSVALVTLRDASTKNALTSAALQELSHTFAEVDEDPDIRAVVLTGAGDAFCSGHHIGELRDDPMQASDIEANRPFSMPRLLRKPVLAAINGPAYGGGLILALSCDLRYASPRASFCASGVRMGLLPIGGQLAWLPHLMATAVATEMLLTGEALDAPTAQQAGFITKIFSADALLKSTIEKAHLISRNAPTVAASIKRGIQMTISHGAAAAFAFEDSQAAVHASSGEAREGIAAFLGKRQPVFR